MNSALVSSIHVESNALNTWKLNILTIIDCRISFYCYNLDLLPPKPQFSFRKGSTNSIGSLFWHTQIRLLIMLWSFGKMYNFNTLKLYISTAKTYKHNLLDERACH